MAELKIKADSGAGTVSLKGPNATTDNAAVQLTLPVDDGTPNQYLKTDGSGALSWATVDTSIADDSITEAKLDVSNDPTNGLFLQANSGGGGLTWANAGITELDQWVLTSSVTSNGDLTSNLARAAFTGGASPLGTGMSQSSGIFSFPSTGKWLIFYQAKFGINDSDNVDLVMYATTDNSSYSTVAVGSDGQNGSGSKEGSASGFYFLDVTDVSNVKVKFGASSIGSGSQLSGDSGKVATGFLFIRIGDT